MASSSAEQGIAAQVSRMADGLSRLVSQHIALAKLELAADARAVGVSVATIAALAPFVLVGYTLLCAAAAWAIAPWVGIAGGLAIVGGVNVAGGIGGILYAVRRLQTRQMLGTTRAELSQSAHLFANGAPKESAQLSPGAAMERRADGR